MEISILFFSSQPLATIKLKQKTIQRKLSQSSTQTNSLIMWKLKRTDFKTFKNSL